MRVPRSYIGSMVEAHWLDPICRRHETTDLDDVPKGRAALAQYRDRGILDDITDGVLRLIHSEGITPDISGDKTYTMFVSHVPEELVTKVIVYDPRPQQPTEATP